MPTVTPVVPHPPVPIVCRDRLAVLEYRSDKLSKKLSRALGRIFAMELARLNSAPAWTTPTFEVVPAPTLKCRHGLRETWCATCAMLSRSGRSKQHGGLSYRFLTMVNRQVGVKNCAGCAHDGEGFKKKTITRTISAIEDRSGYVWQKKIKAVVLTPIEPGWGWVVPKFGDALSLAEYAARHRNDENATLPHLSNRCDACEMFVTVLHDADRCAAKVLAEQRAVAEMQAARREAWKQRRHAALIAQGLYSPEAFDREILVSRGSITAEAVKQFDRDLSRKGNKYRIQ